MPLYSQFLATGSRKYPQFKRPVHNSFLYTARHIAVTFFSVMEFVKSNHSATLKMNPWKN